MLRRYLTTLVKYLPPANNASITIMMYSVHSVLCPVRVPFSRRKINPGCYSPDVKPSSHLFHMKRLQARKLTETISTSHLSLSLSSLSKCDVYKDKISFCKNDKTENKSSQNSLHERKLFSSLRTIKNKGTLPYSPCTL